jgi:hypothetical protein
MTVARLVECGSLGEKMSTQQLLMEFEWLVPRQHQWDITTRGIDSFRVVFPSKPDLVRERRLKPVDVEGTSITTSLCILKTRHLGYWINGIYLICGSECSGARIHYAEIFWVFLLSAP